MNKEKLLKLVKYQTEMKDKLAVAKPHAKRGNVHTYKAFLENEIRMVTLKIEEAKILGVK